GVSAGRAERALVRRLDRERARGLRVTREHERHLLASDVLQGNAHLLVVAAELPVRVEEAALELDAHVDGAVRIARADEVREREERPSRRLRRPPLEPAREPTGEDRQELRLLP